MFTFRDVGLAAIIVTNMELHLQKADHPLMVQTLHTLYTYVDKTTITLDKIKVLFLIIFQIIMLHVDAGSSMFGGWWPSYK